MKLLMAEVPVSGKIEKPDGSYDFISGQIDRLYVDGDHVWIVDYKSNRPSPRNTNDIPRQYKKQLSAYKSLIEQIYPKHHVKCALLWTDGPHMMEVVDFENN
jgi:ATP-dependent helicase/nuclease subunit A